MALEVDQNGTTSNALALLEAEEEELPVDLSQLRAIPVRKTMLLINNFVANTSRFLNHFALVCEDKCNAVSTQLTRLEVSLAILETKLNSIPDLDTSAQPSSSSETPSAPAPEVIADLPPPTPADDTTLPPPPPSEGDEAAPVIGPVAPPVDVDDSSEMKLKDDPRFANYFMMKRMNMPDGAIMHKMQMDGLDPNIWSMDHDGPTIAGDDNSKAIVTIEPPPPAPEALQLVVAEENPSDSLQPPPEPPEHSEPISMPFPPPPTMLEEIQNPEHVPIIHQDSIVSVAPPPPDESEGPPPPPSVDGPPPPPVDDEFDSSEGEEEEAVVVEPPPVSLEESPATFMKLKDDPAFEKYFKMQRMNLPMGAIMQKLMMDGIREDLFDLDPEGPSPNDTGGGGAPPASNDEESTEAAPQASMPPHPMMGLPPPPVPVYDDDDDDEFDD